MATMSEAPPVTLEQAIDTAFAFVEGLSERLRGKVYGLEETDWKDGRWLVTISLIRPSAPTRVTVPSSLLGQTETPAPSWIHKVVEVDGKTGRVVRMVGADR
jgi:hypothetical protein